MRTFRPWLMAVLALALMLGSIVAVRGYQGGSPSSEGITPVPHDGRGGSVWGANYFPNVPLITHTGEIVHFFDDLIKDKVVAINFIYTTCPDACPMETARLLEVHELIGDRMDQYRSGGRHSGSAREVCG